MSYAEQCAASEQAGDDAEALKEAIDLLKACQNYIQQTFGGEEGATKQKAILLLGHLSQVLN